MSAPDPAPALREAEPLLLFVDDEQYQCTIFKQVFGGKFRLEAVTSGAAALEVLRREPVAVIVSDQRMPEMTGNELMMRVKSTYPETVRIIVTAFDDPEPIYRAVNDGLVARYVIKPWDREDLENILVWAIQLYSLNRIHATLQYRLLQTERLAALGTMAAAVLHDLNQPLAFLLENSKRLEELARSSARLGELVRAHRQSLPADDAGRLDDLAAELPDIASDMLTGCRDMHNITSQLRTFVRPSTAVDERQSCDPLPTIRFAISACREIAVRAQGRIVYEGPETLPQVCVGATELSQVMINLIANAAQALLRRGRRGGRVSIAAAEIDRLLRVRIVDDGPGMSREVLAKVGTPFYTTRAEGTGLGVVQCRRIVENASGSLTIESEEGVGTTVTVLLPKS